PRISVFGFRAEGERISAALSESGDLIADRFLVATGAWSEELLEPFGLTLKVFPVRGQIVLFNPGYQLLRRIVQTGKNDVVPRDVGRVMAGSTEEEVGFIKETTHEAISGLTDYACALVPALADAPIEAAWAGLRPATRDELPHLGRVPGTANLYLAAG